MASLENSIFSPDQNVRHMKPPVVPQIVATSVCCIGPVIVGLSLGYSSPAIPELCRENILDTKDKQSWFASLLTLGAIAGVPITGLLLDNLGRKATIMLSCLPFSIGWLLMQLVQQTNYIVLYCSRILVGIGMGMNVFVTPIYIGEIASPHLRGLLGAMIQLGIAVGIVLAYGLGIALTWQWLAVLGSCLAAALVVLMLLLPETPRWYLKKHNFNGALKALKRVRGPYINVEPECLQMALHLEQGGMTAREFFSSGQDFMLLQLSLTVYSPVKILVLPYD